MRCFALFALSFFMSHAAWGDEIPGTGIVYGNWSGAAYTFDDGTFSHCVVSAVFNHGNTLFFSVNEDATVTVGVSSPTDIFTPNQEFPVALFVDRRAPFYGNAVAPSPTFAVFNIADFDRALDSFRRGQTLVVQSQFGEVPFDLTGTSRALSMAFDCAVQNLQYSAPAPAVANHQVDPAILMQVATGNITALGVTDFTFLSGAEMSELFPNADPSVPKVFWRSSNLGLLSGVVVGSRDGASDLKVGDAEDLANLAKLCSGDFVTGVRQLTEVAVEMREIRAACTTAESSSEHYLTKFFVGENIVYSWLWFEGGKAPAEGAPERKKMSESAALQTASFLAD